jgi:hypothetical protein
LDQGADVNARDDFNRMPLNAAAEQGASVAFQILLD